MHGFVYFLINSSIPGLVKVGHTNGEIDSRLRQLNSTGVPAPFELAACFSVPQSALAEKLVHEALKKRRYSDDREFFSGNISEILSEAMPTLLSHLAAEVSAEKNGKTRRKHTYDLEPKSVEVLLYLAGRDRQYGYSEYTILRDSNEPELKTEARLAHLKELRLVSERKSRREFEPSRWIITSEGKKFLFDYGHITDDMLTSKGWT